jgi:hypothetical protein
MPHAKHTNTLDLHLDNPTLMFEFLTSFQKRIYESRHPSPNTNFHLQPKFGFNLHHLFSIFSQNLALIYTTSFLSVIKRTSRTSLDHGSHHTISAQHFHGVLFSEALKTWGFLYTNQCI